MKGTVVRSTGSWYRVMASDGTTTDCRLRGQFRLRDKGQTNPIAVGDQVEVTLQDDGTGVITAVDERRNCLIRRATKLSRQTHLIATNIDLMCIVTTLAAPRTSLGFTDRLLVSAEAYHIPPLIVVNKTDLHTPELNELMARREAIYTAAGYRLLPLSARTGEGLGALRQAVEGGTVLFVGHSGVGKSALLNALDPTLHLKVGAISDWSSKGRHTTTFAELHPFAGGFLVDTPGIKEFGMVDYSAAELSHFFPEMRPLLAQCRFANCTHVHEPHCAVRRAVEEGDLATERYESYLNMLASLDE
ncbi:MAG: ribosome small subunit-dependent GTPase A [Bacteroidales bacterium]|nr:ribosome small subunit-dependent GTPase A [Bacteroidales bacterium]MBQ9639224.1 ribosome small subunit-dependent GTPase A [Bacteroidales bacterium]